MDKSHTDTVAEDQTDKKGPEQNAGSEEKDEASVTKATRLSARLIYEVIRRDGEEELTRPFVSLIWSGVAAGILISLSVVGEAVLRTHLPDEGMSYLIENLGYSLGFVAVIMGRMQLFTENTITTVLPVVAHHNLKYLKSMAKLWSTVLIANVIGAMVAAYFLTLPGLMSVEMETSVRELSEHAMGMGAWSSFLRAIPAGILIAALVWMLPTAQSNGFAVIVVFTWLIAAGDLTHIIAGSVEMGYLLWLGDLGLVQATTGFFVPVLIGNVIGGTVIFTLLAWGQVKNEVVHNG